MFSGNSLSFASLSAVFLHPSLKNGLAPTCLAYRSPSPICPTYLSLLLVTFTYLSHPTVSPTGYHPPPVSPAGYHHLPISPTCLSHWLHQRSQPPVSPTGSHHPHIFTYWFPSPTCLPCLSPVGVLLELRGVGPRRPPLPRGPSRAPGRLREGIWNWRRLLLTDTALPTHPAVGRELDWPKPRLWQQGERERGGGRGERGRGNKEQHFC